MASTNFAHLSKQVLAEEFKEKSIDEKEVLAVIEEEGRTWMTPIYEYLTEEILPEEKRKARSIRRKAGITLLKTGAKSYVFANASPPLSIRKPTSWFRNTSFKPGDIIYRINEASQAKDRGKLGPKREGPCKVTEALGKGALVTDIQKKDKNEAKTDKTKHGMEKRKKVKVKAESKEILNRPS
ncbi:hypothetical protein Tco_0727213, partial [Tanacetum coccineum]